MVECGTHDITPHEAQMCTHKNGNGWILHVQKVRYPTRVGCFIALDYFKRIKWNIFSAAWNCWQWTLQGLHLLYPRTMDCCKINIDMWKRAWSKNHPPWLSWFGLPPLMTGRKLTQVLKLCFRREIPFSLRISRTRGMTPRYPLPPKQQLTIVRRVAF